MTRRDHLRGLFALAAAASAPLGMRAASDPPIPPQGIGRRIRHVSYSDQGGRPDGVQVMVNRRHVYVGHMFSDGVTILDAADPRRLKPVGFFTAGVNTRTHHLQVADDLLLLANGANIVAMQSYDNHARLFREHARRQHYQPQEVPLGPEHSRHLAPRRDEGDCLPRNARPRHQPPVVAGWTLRLCVGAFRRLHRSHSVHRRFAGHDQAGDRVALVAAGHASGGRREADAARGAAGGAPSHDHGRQSRLWRVARWRVDHPRYQRPDQAHAALAHQLVAAVSRRHAHAAAVAGPRSGRRGRRSQRRTMREGHVSHVRRGRARAGESGADLHAAHAEGSGLLRHRHVRSAQPAREPAGILPQRGHHFRDLRQRRRAGVRHQGRVRAEGNRLLGAAGSEAADRPAARTSRSRPRPPTSTWPPTD